MSFTRRQFLEECVPGRAMGISRVLVAAVLLSHASAFASVAATEGDVDHASVCCESEGTNATGHAEEGTGDGIGGMEAGLPVEEEEEDLGETVAIDDVSLLCGSEGVECVFVDYDQAGEEAGLADSQPDADYSSDGGGSENLLSSSVAEQEPGYDYSYQGGETPSVPVGLTAAEEKEFAIREREADREDLRLKLETEHRAKELEKSSADAQLQAGVNLASSVVAAAPALHQQHLEGKESKRQAAAERRADEHDGTFSQVKATVAANLTARVLSKWVSTTAAPILDDLSATSSPPKRVIIRAGAANLTEKILSRYSSASDTSSPSPPRHITRGSAVSQDEPLSKPTVRVVRFANGTHKVVRTSRDSKTDSTVATVSGRQEGMHQKPRVKVVRLPDGTLKVVETPRDSKTVSAVDTASGKRVISRPQGGGLSSIFAPSYLKTTPRPGSVTTPTSRPRVSPTTPRPRNGGRGSGTSKWQKRPSKFGGRTGRYRRGELTVANLTSEGEVGLLRRWWLRSFPGLLSLSRCWPLRDSVTQAPMCVGGFFRPLLQGRPRVCPQFTWRLSRRL